MPHTPPDPALALHVCPPEFEALVLACGVPWKTIAGGGLMPKGTNTVRDAICHTMLSRWNGKAYAPWSPGQIGGHLRMCPSTVVRSAERHQARLDEIDAAYALAFGPKPGQPRPCDGDGHGFDTEAARPIFRVADRPCARRDPDGHFSASPHMKVA